MLHRFIYFLVFIYKLPPYIKENKVYDCSLYKLQEKKATLLKKIKYMVEAYIHIQENKKISFKLFPACF
jgi:hypothetical protein